MSKFLDWGQSIVKIILNINNIEYKFEFENKDKKDSYDLNYYLFSKIQVPKST